MASWHSKVTLCHPPQPRSLQEETSPRHLSWTSTSALSTGHWCLGSAACYRYVSLIGMEYSQCFHPNFHRLFFFIFLMWFIFFSSRYLGVVTVTSEHSAVLSQCSGVALLSYRQQEQNRFPSGPPPHCPIQPTNAWGKYSLYTAGT